MRERSFLLFRQRPETKAESPVFSRLSALVPELAGRGSVVVVDASTDGAELDTSLLVLDCLTRGKRFIMPLLVFVLPFDSAGGSCWSAGSGGPLSDEFVCASSPSKGSRGVSEEALLGALSFFLVSRCFLLFFFELLVAVPSLAVAPSGELSFRRSFRSARLFARSSGVSSCSVLLERLLRVDVDAFFSFSFSPLCRLVLAGLLEDPSRVGHRGVKGPSLGVAEAELGSSGVVDTGLPSMGLLSRLLCAFSGSCASKGWHSGCPLSSEVRGATLRGT